MLWDGGLRIKMRRASENFGSKVYKVQSSVIHGSSKARQL
jgi:hypothetical protein